jgi:hypothetical protein
MNEITERLAELEGKYGDRFQELHEEFVHGRMDRERFNDYVEWSGMTHALRAYSEGEDYDYYTEEETPLGGEELRGLTSSRIELLDRLAVSRASSINELAGILGRDVKNVYNDIKFLERIGFVKLSKEGRGLVPELLVQELTISLG